MLIFKREKDKILPLVERNNKNFVSPVKTTASTSIKNYFTTKKKNVHNQIGETSKNFKEKEE